MPGRRRGLEGGRRGRWSWDLLEHALGRSPSRNVGDVREQLPPLRAAAEPADAFRVGPLPFLIEYRDGLKATVLLLNGHVDDTTFAARVDGEKQPVSTLFYLPPPPGAAFLEALAMKIEDFLATGKPPYPVERTLLTGGILDWVLESRVREAAAAGDAGPGRQLRPAEGFGFLRGSDTHPV